MTWEERFMDWTVHGVLGNARADEIRRASSDAEAAQVLRELITYVGTNRGAPEYPWMGIEHSEHGGWVGREPWDRDHRLSWLQIARRIRTNAVQMTLFAEANP